MIKCPKCQAQTRLADNEFFGVGLAVHRFIRICDNCGWSIFVSGADPRTKPVQPTADRGPLRRVLRRVLGLV